MTVLGRVGSTFRRASSKTLAAGLPESYLVEIVREIAERKPHAILGAIGPLFNRSVSAENMPFDLPIEPGEPVGFEHLAGLFSSTSLDHSVISMTVRQAAYLYGLVGRLRATTAIEIGRYKGGSTLVIAAALRGTGELWSVDFGEKEKRLAPGSNGRSYDAQLADLLRRLGLRAHLLVGDSRTTEIPTGAVDVVVIDGDHSYEGVRSDFERFGRRVRRGGAILFDDAFDEEMFSSHSDTVGRLVKEIVQEGEFRLARRVNRMAHLERVAGEPRVDPSL